MYLIINIFSNVIYVRKISLGSIYVNDKLLNDKDNDV